MRHAPRRAHRGGDGRPGARRPLDAPVGAESDVLVLSSPDDASLVYLVLGSAGSGRRQVLADLIGAGMSEGERAVVLLAASEKPDSLDGSFSEVRRWRLDAGGSVEAEIPADATRVFIVLDGRANPVEQIESLKGWLDGRGLSVARVLCVVDCGLAERHPRLFAWFEACIHFSDVVLLSRREGVSNKWISDFREKFEKKFYPCLFEFVKGGRVGNPALVLIPEARRISHVFDETEWVVDDEESEDSDDEVEMKPEEDPYFERRGGGRRVLELPDIADFLTEGPR